MGNPTLRERYVSHLQSRIEILGKFLRRFQIQNKGKVSDAQNIMAACQPGNFQGIEHFLKRAQHGEFLTNGKFAHVFRGAGVPEH